MKLRRTSLALLAIMMACAFAAGPAHAATFTVNSTSDLSDLTPGDGICDADETPAVECTLRAAVQETNALNDIAPSHTINLPAGTYSVLNGPLVVTWNLDLVGAGTRSTFIARPTNSNVGPSRIFEVEGHSANISRVSISGGIADATNNFFGGNIRVQDGNLTLSETKISGGSGSSGGGISNVRGTLTVLNSTISGNDPSEYRPVGRRHPQWRQCRQLGDGSEQHRHEQQLGRPRRRRRPSHQHRLGHRR
jgi:hypothetical protein